MSYEINNKTLAIIPSDDSAVVLEENEKIKIKDSVIKIINYSCEYFGSSFEGRKIGSKSLIGITHKVPIIIEESNEIIFFPTSSPRLKKCCWISFNNLKEYYPQGNKTKIIFKTGQDLVLDVSFGIIDNQVLRASKLNLILKNRKIDKN